MADVKAVTEKTNNSFKQIGVSLKKPNQLLVNQFNTQSSFFTDTIRTVARDTIANKVSNESTTSTYINSGLQGGTSLMAREGIGAELVRKKYDNLVSQLDPADREGRTNIKKRTRKMTPPVTLSVIESKRPDLGPKKGSIASANKPNIDMNKFANTLGRVGKGNAISGVVLGTTRIATAENKVEETARVSGGVIGGVVAGSVIGAELGALGLNPYTVAGGAIAGSVVGGIGGEEAVNAVIDWFKD